MEINHEALTEAYHAVFDAKDATPAGSLAFMQAYDALQKLELLFVTLDVEIPKRYDGQGR